MSVSRRHFLTYAGLGTYASLINPPTSVQGAAGVNRRGPAPDFFRPISPSRADSLILPRGFQSTVVCRWGDSLATKGPHGAETFGYNCDFVAYFPIDGLTGGHNSNDGYLWVNHEYPNPLFVSGYTQGNKTEKQIITEKLCVGGSIIRVTRRNGSWTHVPGDRQTKRFTALYPTMDVTGPASKSVPRAVGTLANCSGGRTPWFTALSCEENFHNCNGRDGYDYRWADVKRQRIDENQYGWVVEVDPYGELPPVKHSALGRFAHENTAWRLGPNNRFVVYMGDDAQDQFLYKYVSSGTYRENDSRADKRRLLTEGTLYAADFGEGRWLPLELRRNKQLTAAGFKTQADVLVRARDAARAVGATPLDRPEDCEVHPRDGSLYLALTKNTRHGNFYGQIVRLIEDNGNAEGERFRFEIFLAGGPQSGMACPDNLAFDSRGNLWVVCDMSASSIGRGAYESFGNNGLFYVPTSGRSAGDAFQFASGPVDCELTGPWFNENEDTLFMAVQHPGELTRDIDNPTSRWPDGKGIPKPSVVAITGFQPLVG